MAKKEVLEKTRYEIAQEHLKNYNLLKNNLLYNFFFTKLTLFGFIGERTV